MKSSKRKRCTTNEGTAATALLGLLPTTIKTTTTDNNLPNTTTTGVVNDPIMNMKLTNASSLRQQATNHTDTQLIRGLFLFHFY